MNRMAIIKGLVVMLVLLASRPAFGQPMCGTEICVELFGFNPITGEIFLDSALVPKGIPEPTSPFCLALDHTFPPSPPFQGVIGRHFWLAVLPPGGTGSLEKDLVFIGLINAVPVFNKLPFPIPFFSFVTFHEGSAGLVCFPQETINAIPSGSTYLFAGGYTTPLDLPVTLGTLLGNAVSGVTTFSVTIGD